MAFQQKAINPQPNQLSLPEVITPIELNLPQVKIETAETLVNMSQISQDDSIPTENFVSPEKVGSSSLYKKKQNVQMKRLKYLEQDTVVKNFQPRKGSRNKRARAKSEDERIARKKERNRICARESRERKKLELDLLKADLRITQEELALEREAIHDESKRHFRDMKKFGVALKQLKNEQKILKKQRNLLLNLCTEDFFTPSQKFEIKKFLSSTTKSDCHCCESIDLINDRITEKAKEMNDNHLQVVRTRKIINKKDAQLSKLKESRDVLKSIMCHGCRECAKQKEI